MNYFKPIILKFKIFIYNRNSKIMHNFAYVRAIFPPVAGGGGEYPLSGEKFFLIGMIRKSIWKYAKLMVELYV